MKGRLLVYMTMGFPSIESQIQFLEGIDPSLVSKIELGYPSSDPRYDGPTIRGTHFETVREDQQGIKELFEACKRASENVVALAYFSDLRNQGDLVQFLAGCGAREFIIPDLLIDYPEKLEDVESVLGHAGVSFVPFFNAATPDNIIVSIGSRASSWIYFGLLPSTGISIPYDTRAVVGRALRLIKHTEVNFGFGIRNCNDVRKIVEAGGTGIAIGSALVGDLERRNFESAYRKLDEFSEALNSAV